MTTKPTTPAPATAGARAVLQDLTSKAGLARDRYTKALTLPGGQVVQVLEVPLPVSGVVLCLRRGKGRDRIAAGNQVRNEKNPFEFAHAMLAQVLLRLDGSPVRMEELDEMDEDDLDALTLARAGEDVDPSPARKA